MVHPPLHPGPARPTGAAPGHASLVVAILVAACRPGADVHTHAGLPAAPSQVAQADPAATATSAPRVIQDLPGPADDAELARRLETPEGVVPTLWAESPLLYNPAAIDIDARGRVWVAEAVNYRQWDGRNPGRHHEAGDRIVVLEDRDGDGRAETSTVFAQDPELVSPLGICVLPDRVLVSCSPAIWAYFDDDGDLRADRREVFLEGFGGFDHDHGVHSMVFGPDGRLVFAAGNAGPHVVTDADGWTLRSGSLYTGGGPSLADNRPGLVSDDGETWVGGLVLRCDLDGSGLEVLAHNFRNNYEVTVDSFGNHWQTDNDDDGNRSCRAVFVMEGGDYGYFSADGSRYWGVDRRPGQTTERAHWHQDDPGVAPTNVITGAGGPTGTCVYEGTLMPDLQGVVLGSDAGANRVFALRPTAAGAGFDLEVGALVASRPLDADGDGDPDDDQHRLFRPSDTCVAPDGSIFVADWYDPGVGGHLAGDRQAQGRIVRLAPADHTPRVPELDVSTPEGAVAALRSPNLATRATGWLALAEQGESAAPALEALLADPDPWLAARAPWLLARHGGRATGHERLMVATADRDGWQGPRSASLVRALRSAGRSSTDIALRLGSTVPDPAVLRELACGLRGASWTEAAPILAWLANLAAGRHAGDRTLLEAVGLAWDPHAERLDDQVLRGLAAEPSRWSDGVASVAWRLRPAALLPAWITRAHDRTLPREARVQALTSLGFHEEQAAAEAMLALAQVGPEDTRELAAFWVVHRDDDTWHTYDLARHLDGAAFEERDLRWRSGRVDAQRRTVPVDVDISGAERLGLVVTDGGDGNGCDWADWLEPRLVGPAGELALTELPWVTAEAQWGSVRRGTDCDGGALDVEGEVFTDGIGTHALSEIVFDLPAGYERLLATAAMDDEGVQGHCGATIEFLVYAQVPAEPLPLAQLAATLLDRGADEESREDAADRLALDPAGGAWLVRRASTEGLDDEVLELVASSIFRNPDLGVRALAGQVFPRPDAPQALPPVADLLALDGDAARGAVVFLSDEAACSTCHRFEDRGGDVGPDLTRVSEKYARAELLDAMLNPAAAIAFGYEGWVFELADGRLLTGFLLADGERLVVKDSQGERHVLEAHEVTDRWRQQHSLMPDNAALGLDPGDLADLLAFLERRDDEPRFGPWRDLFDGESLEGWTIVGGDRADDGEPTWTAAGGVLACRGTPVGYLRTEEDHESFELELDWRFPQQPGNSGVLLRLDGEDKIWPRSMEAQLHHRDAGDIWNIDAFDMQVDPGRTSGRRTRKRAPSNEVPLGAWNHYRILLHDRKLVLEVNGEVQNEATWCEPLAGPLALQSEGAPIEFRRIRLRPILD